MADTNYNNQSTYSKQEGDEIIIANGGFLKLESGGEVEVESGATFSIESGGKIAAESGGEIEVQSGGFFDIQGGASLYLTSSNNTVTASQMKELVWRETQISVIANSVGAAAGVLSVINLPSAGYIILSLADGASNASAWLTSMDNGGIIGHTMVIFMRGVGSTGSVYVSTSGVSIVGTTSNDVSSFSIQNSVASSGRITLLCTAADEWSIVDKSEVGIVERGA